MYCINNNNNNDLFPAFPKFTFGSSPEKLYNMYMQCLEKFMKNNLMVY